MRMLIDLNGLKGTFTCLRTVEQIYLKVKNLLGFLDNIGLILINDIAVLM